MVSMRGRALSNLNLLVDLHADLRFGLEYPFTPRTLKLLRAVVPERFA